MIQNRNIGNFLGMDGNKIVILSIGYKCSKSLWGTGRKEMFTDILKDLRKQKHVTQIQLAEAIGVSPGNVGDWESGKSRPNYGALISLSRFFGVSADVLLGIDDSVEERQVLREGESELLAMIRMMDERDRQDIYGLAQMKYTRAYQREA